MILFLISDCQSFHILEESPWPILLGMQLFSVFMSFIYFMHFSNSAPFMLNMGMTLFLLFVWGRDIILESTFMGFHTQEMEKSMKWSMGWFIMSEIFFFLSFFWGFFHFSLNTNMESGDQWPPLHIDAMDPFAIPLLNTMILLSSGITLTYSHHSLMSGDFKESCRGLLFTFILGIYFTLLQVFEYKESIFSFSDSLYGSIFFIATGFHGMHVIIGTILLIISFNRMLKNQFMSNHHIGFETASWYWHFVDVVWLFLFCCIYWWGSYTKLST